LNRDCASTCNILPAEVARKTAPNRSCRGPCGRQRTFKRLAQLYATVRNAYAEKIGFVADLAYKTRRLVEQNIVQGGVGLLTKSVTFDVKTLEALRSEKGSDEGKVFNLVRGLQKQIDDDTDAAPILQPLKDRAERILKDLEKRTTNGKAAMDILAALAAEKDAAEKAAKDTGLTPKAFAVFWTLREEPSLKQCGIDPLELAKEIEKLLARFPNFRVNADEQRQLRAALYRPLITIAKEPRTLIVDRIVANLLN